MKKLRSLIPRRECWIPLAMCIIINMAAYYGGRLLTVERSYSVLALPLDNAIPLLPWTVLIYVLAFPTWALGFLVAAREERPVAYELLTADQIAKLCCLVVFLLLPTIMERPQVEGSGFGPWLLRLIYALDEPRMLFPSMHCMESWFCFRSAMRCQKTGRGYRAFCLISALLVCVSVVTVKQHVLVDIPAGIAVAELGLWVSRKTRAGRIYERLVPESWQQ